MVSIFKNLSLPEN